MPGSRVERPCTDNASVLAQSRSGHLSPFPGRQACLGAWNVKQGQILLREGLAVFGWYLVNRIFSLGTVLPFGGRGGQQQGPVSVGGRLWGTGHPRWLNGELQRLEGDRLGL